MYKSKEIRWFSSGQNLSVLKWFETYELTFDTVESRTDFYLPLENEAIGIKLREGRIEIKHRTKLPEAKQLTSTIVGFYEEWFKWSFKANESDPVYTAIVNDKNYDWLETTKKRMGIILTEEGGEAKIVALDKEPPYGCHIEYTQLEIKDRRWYTFGLEWFGEEFIELSSTFISKITGDSRLGLRHSMGYPAFLDLGRLKTGLFE